MPVCIWCKKHSDANQSIEHIIPESLGCPEEFVLKDGQVCTRCNNALGNLDKIIIDEYDFFLFEKGIKRKKGKRPIINSRGNVVSNYSASEKFMTFNMEKETITDPFGTKVAGFRGLERNINATFSANGRLASIKFSNRITNRKKFRQAMYKIAFSSLAYFLPTEDLSNPMYDHIRKFVLKGIGDKTIICIPSKDQSGNRVDAPFKNDLGQYFIVIKIYYLEFWVDLSNDGRFTEHAIFNLQTTHTKDQWFKLPYDKKT